jgi:CBS domain-containing protein
VQIRDAMSSEVLTVGPTHTMRDAADRMAEHNVGSAVVIDPEQPGPGIVTERDLLHSIAAGQDPNSEPVGAHLTSNVVFAAPDWSIEQAAEAMIRGGFRHLVVVEDGEPVGMLSMRDIMRVWVGRTA